MKKRLLLLTRSFPFARGEEFLETEITYLVQRFDVTIIPCSANIDPNCQRSLPNNVTVNIEVMKELPTGSKNNFSWLIKHPQKIYELCKLYFSNCNIEVFDFRKLIALFVFIVKSVQISTILSRKYPRNSFSIAYSYWLTPSSLAVCLLRKQGRVRVAVARTHGFDLYHERSPLGILPGQKYTVSALDRIFCISEHGRNYLRNLYPSCQYKFDLCRLGVFMAPCRNQLSTSNCLHIVTCSYPSPVKRIDLLVRALKHTNFPIMWTHLGGMPESKISELVSLLPQNVKWKITGHLSNREILRFYQKNIVDLFVNVSLSEGLPVSIMEALSYGIPVAATDTGGVSELILSGKNGFLWPVDIDPDCIARTLKEFYLAPKSMKYDMRNYAWQTWHETVNADIQYSDFTQRLLEIVAG